MAIDILKAQSIAANCERAFRIAGHQADVPYSQAQLCECIAALRKELIIQEGWVTLHKRQLAAANARYQKLSKKTGQHVADEEQPS